MRASIGVGIQVGQRTVAWILSASRCYAARVSHAGACARVWTLASEPQPAARQATSSSTASGARADTSTRLQPVQRDPRPAARLLSVEADDRLPLRERRVEARLRRVAAAGRLDPIGDGPGDEDVVD